MPISIDVPEAAWSTQEIPLGGLNYTFNYSYNDRDSRWRLDIKLGETDVISGLKLIESQRLLNQYNLTNFNHGDLVVIRYEDDGKPVTFDNIGLNKPYELVYLTNAELGE